ncbi:MAG: DJ-1/PfpI family protein [Actinomyces sp.]|uniref:DJ-1 family glyoxalase III n=1 Tax=Actinomyces sp. TaxID=29317 RepID=UPI0026DD1557|nr:DJ-1 family glyoxalase III [Actinomyces sp.]MDO4242429.1 DJ-1/PfpI family protein [Actinomyces sp.]
MPTPDQLSTEATVAVLIAPGLEEVEALAVVDVLYRAGIDVDMLAVGEDLEITSSHRITVRCDALLSEADLASYTMLVLPGGLPGTPNLRSNPVVVEEVSRRMGADLPLAAICAAPSILAELGLLTDRRATANPGFLHVLDAHGAVTSQEPVVVDANLVTSRGMATAVDFGLEIVRMLLDEEAVDRLKAAIVHQG